MTSCLVNELASFIELSGIQTVTSVYFGGGTHTHTHTPAAVDVECSHTGTPSLAEPSTVEAVLAEVRDNSELKNGAEVTLEANPTSAQTDKLR